MKKKLFTVILNVCIAAQLISCNSVPVHAESLTTAEINTENINTEKDISSYLQSVYKTTSRPEYDSYVFDGFKKIENNKYSSTPVDFFSGTLEECVSFRDYFNYEYGYTSDIHVIVYRASDSEQYKVGILDTANLDKRLNEYFTEVKKAKEIADSLKGNTNDETIMNIINWVQNNVFYDYSLHGNATNEELINSYYGAYSGKKVICTGFSMVVHQLCAMNGIPSRIELGTYNGDMHAWNSIQFDSGFKHVDVLNPNSVISDQAPAEYIFETR